jgi:ribokinase
MITVLGSINIDLIGRASRLPKPGETVSGYAFATEAGGKGANQALAARRAGADVRLVGAVGQDRYADMALALLRDADVDLRSVSRVTESTGTALVSVGHDGENSIIVIPGANDTLTPVDAENAVAAMNSGDILMLQLELPVDVVEVALVAARVKQIKTVLNIAPFNHSVRKIADLADVIIANESEFELLSGERVSDGKQEHFLKRRQSVSPQTFIVTLGAKGVVAVHEGEVYRANGLKITPVDTVGAGDTFCGYLAAGLSAGLEFHDTLRRAAIAGSLACLRRGAQSSIPHLDEVQCK